MGEGLGLGCPQEVLLDRLVGMVFCGERVCVKRACGWRSFKRSSSNHAPSLPPFPPNLSITLVFPMSWPDLRQVSKQGQHSSCSVSLLKRGDQAPHFLHLPVVAPM